MGCKSPIIDTQLTEAQKMKIAETLATIGTIIGFYLISENVLLAGFAISLTSNILWIIWSVDADARGILVVNCLLAFSSVNGILGNF